MAEAFEEAGSLFERNQFEYAIFLLSDVINTDYRKSEALCKRAMCYMNMNRFKEASEDLGKAIEADRTIVSAYVKQAKCYLAIGEFDNAIVALTNLSQVDPDSTFAKCELDKMKELKERDKKAKKLFEERNYEEVIKIMDECLKKAEICVRFQLMKAECLIYLGNHESALLIVNDVLFSHKDDVEAVAIRAMNLLYQEKYNLGLAELREVISSSPRATNLYRMYRLIAEKRKNADLALRQNKYNEAKILYHQILDIDVKNIRQRKNIYTKLADISYTQKLYDDAIEASTLALEIDNKIAEALKIRGDANYETQEYDLAIEDYRDLIKVENNEIHRLKLEVIQRKHKMEVNNYSILGVTKDTPASEIKKAYHKLAIVYHPDKNHDKSKYVQHKCKVKFAKINQAYNELQKIHKC